MGDDSRRATAGTSESAGDPWRHDPPPSRAARPALDQEPPPTEHEPYVAGSERTLRQLLVPLSLTAALAGLFVAMFQLGTGHPDWRLVTAFFALPATLLLVAPVIAAALPRTASSPAREITRLTPADVARLDQSLLRAVSTHLAVHASRLMRDYAEARQTARDLAHPLLAMEFNRSARRLQTLLSIHPASPGARRTDEKVWVTSALELLGPGLAERRRLHRRLRAARLAYRLNLPLTREASENFAATVAAARIDRLADAMAGYLAPARAARTGGSDV